MTLPVLTPPETSPSAQRSPMSEQDRPARYALIPTHNRPDELARLVGQLEAWADTIVIIDNASTPPVSEVEYRALFPNTMVIVVEVGDQPPNLYRLWNVGFEAIHTMEQAIGRNHQWDIAVLNDDTLLPVGWAHYVSTNLRNHGAAAASTFPFPHPGEAMLKTRHDGNIGSRMCPWAFIIRGELGLRADENFGWWWGDTDLDWQACGKGGVLLLPGEIPANTLANSTTVGALAEQAGRDGEYFVAKWGFRPW